MKPLMLITGGTGMVGQVLLASLRTEYRLRISGLVESDTQVLSPDDELLLGDLKAPQFAQACADGVDAIIHLASNASPACSVGEAMGNVEMADAILSAAAIQGIPKIVIASSVHASGLDYADDKYGISTQDSPRPCCAYGASKVAIESLARLHQIEQGNSVSCLRLGLTGWPLTQQQYAHTWLSNADLFRLVGAALTRDRGFGVYNAVSLDSATRWDLENALNDLGWSPQDRWPVDVQSLPLATSCPCKMFTV